MRSIGRGIPDFDFVCLLLFFVGFFCFVVFLCRFVLFCFVLSFFFFFFFLGGGALFYLIRMFINT